MADYQRFLDFAYAIGNLSHIAALPEINLKYCKRDASIIERI